jgi:hypothetical protein
MPDGMNALWLIGGSALHQNLSQEWRQVESFLLDASQQIIRIESQAIATGLASAFVQAQACMHGHLAP